MWVDKIVICVYNSYMKVENNPITVQYYMDRQRYLTRLADDRRQDELRQQELARQKDSVERINRARELDNRLGQKVDVYA
jgi:hypothetical protein